uniref:Uncharacterized protein n=1 Tax=Candidatus Kentrum sp. LFY TaxID=2126342 RepID=A0A450WQ18_9GAMM|nr:MAG: hypothetical protein BECKLFY1418C_GA0070996_10536 [Candidatus Kentron sp. LFY]
MKQTDLIRIIGDIITKVDVLRAEFPRGTETRNQLDDIRDDIDGFQRRLVRDLIDVNTPKFAQAADLLISLSKELKQMIDDVAKVADTLNTLVKLVGVIQKTVGVIL